MAIITLGELKTYWENISKWATNAAGAPTPKIQSTPNEIKFRYNMQIDQALGFPPESITQNNSKGLVRFCLPITSGLPNQSFPGQPTLVRNVDYQVCRKIISIKFAVNIFDAVLNERVYLKIGQPNFHEPITKVVLLYDTVVGPSTEVGIMDEAEFNYLPANYLYPTGSDAWLLEAFAMKDLGIVPIKDIYNKEWMDDDVMLDVVIHKAASGSECLNLLGTESYMSGLHMYLEFEDIFRKIK